MAKDKKRAHASEAVWDGVRRDRRARRKLTSKSDLQQSAALLRAHADALDALAANAPEQEVQSTRADAAPSSKKKRKRNGAAKKSRKEPD